MKSIVISGPPAVGKSTVAMALADEFDMRYVSGGDVLKEMAKEEGYEPTGSDWWDTKDGLEFLRIREQNYEFDRRLDQRLVKLYAKGDMVITSYTLPWLVKYGTKIWLEGSHNNRVKRMQKRDNISPEEAYVVTKDRYEKNKTFYKTLYGFDFGIDKSVFDIVIQTDKLTAKQVINKTIKFIQKHVT